MFRGTNFLPFGINGNIPVHISFTSAFQQYIHIFSLKAILNPLNSRKKTNLYVAMLTNVHGQGNPTGLLLSSERMFQPGDFRKGCNDG